MNRIRQASLAAVITLALAGVASAQSAGGGGGAGGGTSSSGASGGSAGASAGTSTGGISGGASATGSSTMSGSSGVSTGVVPSSGVTPGTNPAAGAGIGANDATGSRGQFRASGMGVSGAGVVTQGQTGTSTSMDATRPSTGAMAQPMASGAAAPSVARCQSILADRQSYNAGLVQACSATGDPASARARQLQPSDDRAVNSICKGC